MLRKQLLIFTMILALSGCASWFSNVQSLSAVQQRNSHVVLVDEYLGYFNSYAALPTCTEAVTVKCKDMKYLIETMVPAKKDELNALINLKNAVDSATVTDGIQEAERKSFTTFESIAKGSTVQNAIGG